jgi:hypothetical protein
MSTVRSIGYEDMLVVELFVVEHGAQCTLTLTPKAEAEAEAAVESEGR